MVTYYDSAVNNTPVTASGEVYAFSRPTKFWLNLVSNFVSGQTSGAPVTFNLVSPGASTDQITVVYGETRSVLVTGEVVTAIVQSGSSPNVRVVLSDIQQVLQVLTVGIVEGAQLLYDTNTGADWNAGPFEIAAGAGATDLLDVTTSAAGVLHWELTCDTNTTGTPADAWIGWQATLPSGHIIGDLASPQTVPRVAGSVYLPSGTTLVVQVTNNDSKNHYFNGYAALIAGEI